MEKILFIDRDGTILKEPQPSQQIDTLEKFEFLPHAIMTLAKIARETDFSLVMVSNQDGLGTPAFPLEDFQPLQDLMLRTLASENIFFKDILIDDSFPEANSPMRKPRTGMVEKYINQELDRENSWVIGDRETDMQLAANMGIRGVMLDENCGWNDVYRLLTRRYASVQRTTSETDILVEVDLDGRGSANIETGIGFFDHMLDQIARHSGIDLTVRTKGDLRVDEHHTIEDTAIALGEALRKALGDKRGIGRYGFALPMDESRAEVLLDLGGRTHLEWSANFDREKVGDMPTEMVRHFFSSFCQSAACNVHVSTVGENTHHKIEGIFKAFARALGQAVRRTGTELPSTKGTL